MSAAVPFRGAVAASDTRSVPVTHLHIYNVLRTLIAEGGLAEPSAEAPVLRVLDIGCGDGLLIDSLMRLAAAEPVPFELELHGFDIGEQGYQSDGQQSQAIRLLSARHPAIDWASRIRIISDRAPWGYPQGYFSAAVSNQVIEHVHDLDGLLDNIAVAVGTGGASVHLFPLSHCMQEAHCLVPFAHWIRNFDYRVGWIALTSRLGVGRYHRDRRVLGHGGPRDHARKTAAYIQCWTHYRSFRQVSDACTGRGLSLSYHFTKDFFATKLRRVVGLRAARLYRRWNWFGFEWLSFLVLRYFSSATLVVRPISYDIGARIAAEKAHRAAEPARDSRIAA